LKIFACDELSNKEKKALDTYKKMLNFIIDQFDQDNYNYDGVNRKIKIDDKKISSRPTTTTSNVSVDESSRPNTPDERFKKKIITTLRDKVTSIKPDYKKLNRKGKNNILDYTNNDVFENVRGKKFKPVNYSHVEENTENSINNFYIMNYKSIMKTKILESFETFINHQYSNFKKDEINNTRTTLDKTTMFSDQTSILNNNLKIDKLENSIKAKKRLIENTKSSKMSEKEKKNKIKEHQTAIDNLNEKILKIKGKFVGERNTNAYEVFTNENTKKKEKRREELLKQLENKRSKTTDSKNRPKSNQLK